MLLYSQRLSKIIAVQATSKIDYIRSPNPGYTHQLQSNLD